MQTLLPHQTPKPNWKLCLQILRINYKINFKTLLHQKSSHLINGMPSCVWPYFMRLWTLKWTESWGASQSVLSKRMRLNLNKNVKI